MLITITSEMINAVLVFNNAGQPRLTKFYTQLVRFSLPRSPLSSLTHITDSLCRKHLSNNV